MQWSKLRDATKEESNELKEWELFQNQQKENLKMMNHELTLEADKVAEKIKPNKPKQK